MNEIRAQHIASFLEHDGPLQKEDILQNLDTVANLDNRTILDCSLRIVDDEYLTVRIDNENVDLSLYLLICSLKGPFRMF